MRGPLEVDLFGQGQQQGLARGELPHQQARLAVEVVANHRRRVALVDEHVRLAAAHLGDPAAGHRGPRLGDLERRHQHGRPAELLHLRRGGRLHGAPRFTQPFPPAIPCRISCAGCCPFAGTWITASIRSGVAQVMSIE